MSATNKEFQKMIAILAARDCYLAGASLEEIAAGAGVSPATIKRWLKIAQGQDAGVPLARWRQILTGKDVAA